MCLRSNPWKIKCRQASIRRPHFSIQVSGILPVHGVEALATSCHVSESCQYRRGGEALSSGSHPASMGRNVWSSCPENSRNSPDKAGKHSLQMGRQIWGCWSWWCPISVVSSRSPGGRGLPGRRGGLVVVALYHDSEIYAGMLYMYFHGCIPFTGSLADSFGGAFCPEARRLDPVPHVCQGFLDMTCSDDDQY